MMSRPSKTLRTSQQPSSRYRPRPSHPGLSPGSAGARRASMTGLATAAGQKAQRTSKTTQKLVLLPSAPQTKPLPEDLEDDRLLGYETDAGVRVREYKSPAERMNREQRERAGYKRITVYCVCEAMKMKLLAQFLKREHNVQPRVFDEAMYVMYHLPLLPGYGPHSNVRSSVPPSTPGAKAFLTRLHEAEENGYQGSYFASPTTDEAQEDGYVTSASVERSQHVPEPPHESDAEAETYTEADVDDHNLRGEQSEETIHVEHIPEDDVAEVVFFAYGVAVFYGFSESQERSILEDVASAGILKRQLKEEDWEIEECHFTHDPSIAYPRIYNDFFTFKSPSHLLKLSVAHALAQSTLLAAYEATAQRVLSDPRTVAIPKQLAFSGKLQLKRRDALRLTGRLFKLRRDINLVSNVLDVPELFWSEASLKELYGAVRDYMEIDERVKVLNEKLGIASDFLDAIHDHLNNNAMERITWIVIWLIILVIFVEVGEVFARLVVHTPATSEGAGKVAMRVGPAFWIRTVLKG
ncbi:hypothetical protein PISMIDRAFT_95782 [Pisolithus microcarpus 441]|uniref:DUF155 domain-containing protein n=1 Tax=Pisolithus microcarpus 441 TaxID=765257 RepID=A0A0C9ZV39_9AGAM|nr:hypothetical protein BKA83DRAFT_95782 [Pisolithus microcarpus]KIK26067.1 hypothetical protein PISMIDRAFT_95782 [Pisolithus microcarpus 441]